MARKKKPLALFERVTVTDLAAEGKAVARVDDMVVFVPFAVPGDVVDLQVVKKRHRYMEATVAKVHRFSADRVSPVCRHFGVCGGCKWQMLPYKLQLRHKQQQVEDQLGRIGKVELPPISPIIGCERTERYRNKLEFTFSNRRWLTWEEVKGGDSLPCREAVGFHIPGMFDKVLDVEECWLQESISDRIRNRVRTYALERGLPFFDLRAREGFLRTMMVRTSSTGGLMVVMVFYRELRAQREALLEHLRESFPEITSLLYVINGKANDSITDLEVHLYSGEEYIYEEMEGLRFRVGAKSFYQTNSAQAYELYKVVRRFAALGGSELVYDLYTGTGTIALFLSRRARQVIGIEYVPEAIDDAKANSSLNGIGNTQFFAGDMKDLLDAAFIARHGPPEVVVTDPPRAGMHPGVIRSLLAASPERIVYVSCNPATQARDLSLLAEAYRVAAVQPIDMFPHTHHVENVVLLKRR